MAKTDMYSPIYNLHDMIIQCILYGIIGIILGTIVNNIFVYILNNISYKPNVIVEIVLQLIICSIVLSIININFHFFGWAWQSTTPGFIFVSFFFGVQYNAFSNIQKRFIMDKH
jgi:hypothetical protein